MEDGTYPKNHETKDKTFRPVQTFFTVTKKSAIRGMHFYRSPSTEKNIIPESPRELSTSEREISKSFVVISGEIFVAAIDLQSGS